MICSNCSYENDNTARFCSNCGTELRRICQNCGTFNEPTANFCSNCGFALEQSNTIQKSSAVALRPSAYTPKHLAEKILRERKTISGERRTVTVLFFDEVGSTAIGEQLDPGDLYTITQAALGQMMDTVHLYEGTVTQFRGDAIMALFGAPIANEDAARRGVGAALEMQRALGAFLDEIGQQLGIDLRFRVGLNTGRVVVGNIGTDLEVESNARLNLADNLMALDRLQEAQEQLQIVGRIIQDSRAGEDIMQWRYAQHYYHSYGELNLVHGDVEKALANAEACLALAEESNSRKNIVKGRRLRGQALMASGQLAEADEELALALDMAQKVGNPTQLWQTHAAMGDLKMLWGQGEEAGRSYQQAAGVIQQVADKLSDPELRETLLTSTAVRKVVDKSRRDS